jgi:repressor LexA
MADSPPSSHPRHPITERQTRVLAFLHAFIREKGYPPTLREIGAHMGIRSTNGVNDHLRALERKGYIRHGNPGASRAIILTDSPEDTEAPAPATDTPVVKIPVFSSVEPPLVAATIRRPSCLPTAAWAVIVAGEALSASGIRAGDWVFVAAPPSSVTAPVVSRLSLSLHFTGKLVVVSLGDGVLLRYAHPEGDVVRLSTGAAGAPPAYLRAADFARGLRGVAVGLWRGADVRLVAERAA